MHGQQNIKLGFRVGTPHECIRMIRSRRMRGKGWCGALRGEEKYVQDSGGESGRKLANDLEDLNIGLSIPLKFTVSEKDCTLFYFFSRCPVCGEWCKLH